jgi:hypothetical protein
MLVARARHTRSCPYPTIRCGRIRRASRTRWRRLISPAPSRFGCLVCIRTTSGSGTLSSLLELVHRSDGSDEGAGIRHAVDAGSSIYAWAGHNDIVGVMGQHAAAGGDEGSAPPGLFCF